MWCRRLCIAIVVLMTTGCASTTPLPVACVWSPPSSLLQPCPKSLPALRSGATMGDLLAAVVSAYEQYHACRIDHDALIAAFRRYDEVCNSTEQTK